MHGEKEVAKATTEGSCRDSRCSIPNLIKFLLSIKYVPIIVTITSGGRLIYIVCLEGECMGKKIG